MKQTIQIFGLWLAGAALTAALAFAMRRLLGGGYAPDPLALLRGIHVLGGILWVGLLYFFVFVQAPAVAAATAEEGGPGPAAIARHVAPRALWWFRWASLITWGAGAMHLIASGNLVSVASFGLIGDAVDSAYGAAMGVGVWLGTILLINVWVFIWPNQKRILGLVQTVDQHEVVRAKFVVSTVARINAVVSIPTVFFMATAGHGLVV